MSESTLDAARRPPLILRLLASVALLRESGVAMVGTGIVLFWVLVAVFADVISPFDPNTTIAPMSEPGASCPADARSPAGELLCPDGGTLVMGTDLNGRDILSRIVHGSRPVLWYGFLATFCAYFVGIVMGLLAGYRGGWVDDAISFLANVILAFPVMVLYVVVIAIIGASATNVVLAITFASAPGIMRIVRGLTLDLRTRDYVAAAQTRGESNFWVMFVEILPNARGPLIVDACLRMGYVTITIGTLGFLGLGLPPPDPDWGKMIAENRIMISVSPHMVVFPALAISSLVLGLNLLADGLREISMRD